jgi:hypothetical protein
MFIFIVRLSASCLWLHLAVDIDKSPASYMFFMEGAGCDGNGRFLSSSSITNNNVKLARGSKRFKIQKLSHF